MRSKIRLQAGLARARTFVAIYLQWRGLPQD
jgi:hypothetical protein